MRIEISDWIYENTPLEDQVFKAFSTYADKDQGAMRNEDIHINFKNWNPTVREKQQIEQEITKFTPDFNIPLTGAVEMKAGEFGNGMVLRNANVDR